MSTSDAGVTDGGQNGPSGSGEHEQDGVRAFMRHIAARLISLDGKSTPEAQVQFALFEDENRARAIHEFIAALTPEAVSPTIWARWLNGGSGPFMAGGLKRPVKLDEGTGKKIARGSKSLASYRDKVERLREDLQFAERELEHNMALNKSLLQYTVTDHLVSVLSGIFAMGPAWTIMRSLSGHLSDAVGEKLTAGLMGKEQEVVLGAIRADRLAETGQMLKTLDYLSGIDEFEEALRAAILKVVQDFGAKSEKLIKDGRRPRSKEAMMTKVHPKAQAESEEIIQGLKADENWRIEPDKSVV